MFNLIAFSQILSLLKFGYLILDFLFILFLVVVLRQVFSMSTIINDANDSLVLKLGAFTLLGIAISLFVATLVIL